MTTTTTTTKARHPMMAFAAGMIAPGLGLMMTGRLAFALLTALVSVVVGILVPVVVVDAFPASLDKLPAMVFAGGAAVRFGTSVVAAWLAHSDGQRERKGFEHPWWLVGFLVVVFFGTSQLRDRVGARVVAFDRLADSALRPMVSENALMVINKRGFAPEKLAINDVVAVPGRGPVLEENGAPRRGYARVIGLAGSTVEVKEDGSVVVDGFPIVNAPCPPTVPHAGHSCVFEKQATPQGIAERYTTTTSFARAFPLTSVGPGQVFVLPDDRGHKLRAAAGLVAFPEIEGVVVIAR
jgi:hypothetical protein